MTTTVLALALGTLLAVGALAFVLHPLFFGAPSELRPPALPRRTAMPGEERESAVAALREIEFDRATGKLSEADYAQLKGRYTAEALAAMRRESAASGAGSAGVAVVDDIEARVRAYRASHLECPTCGPRPELDALYCSSCGRRVAA